MNSASPPSGPMARMAPGLVAGLFTLVAALLFVGIFLALPVPHYFYALTTIGILALLLSVVGYLAQALSADPYLQRAFSWGYATMGFVVLFAAFLLPLNPGITLAGQLVALIVLLVLVIVWVVGIGWRSRTRAAMHQRVALRQAWASKPAVSAFAYGSPGTATSEVPPPSGNSSTPPGAR